MRNKLFLNEPLKLFKHCLLCPRMCGINRSDGKMARIGFCGETEEIRVAYVGPHFGEEPPLTGKNGSGTVFFSGCSLKCSFCQNHQISHQGMGMSISLEGLLEKLEEMVRVHKVHNINFVTPDHFFPHVFCLVTLLRKREVDLPFVYNLSGYQSVEMLKNAEDYADIYLPDFKYADSSLADRLSKCGDYPQVAVEAIAEMIRQKGFLDACSTGVDLANRGVLVRHLILPGNVENSIKALTSLFLEFGRGLPLSIMSQYYPVAQQEERHLNRPISVEEFERVYSHAMELGFEQLFVQFPEREAQHHVLKSPLLPDFKQPEPFQ